MPHGWSGISAIGSLQQARKRRRAKQITTRSSGAEMHATTGVQMTSRILVVAKGVRSVERIGTGGRTRTAIGICSYLTVVDPETIGA